MTMRRYRRNLDERAVAQPRSLSTAPGEMGIVLSGGGSRSAYQVGALRALHHYLRRERPMISAVVGSSIGAINGLVLSACLKDGLDHAVEQLQELWLERTFRNTFVGTPSQAFLRAVHTAVVQYLSPGPNPTSRAIFDPSPLGARIDQVIREHGGLHPDSRDPKLSAVAVMTTVEGSTRRPLLFLSTHRPIAEDLLEGASFEVCYTRELSARHGLASAALPSILPPVELDTEEGRIRLVDGGISQNVPVDPIARLGVRRVVVIDNSGRSWWHDQYGHAHDTRPTWEVPAALKTFCLRPPDTCVLKNHAPLGPLLKETVGHSTRKFMTALGPTWPLFSLLRQKFGEVIAYEAVSYVALDPDYLQATIERGYSETLLSLRRKAHLEFQREESMEKWAETL